MNCVPVKLNDAEFPTVPEYVNVFAYGPVKPDALTHDPVYVQPAFASSYVVLGGVPPPAITSIASISTYGPVPPAACSIRTVCGPEEYTGLVYVFCHSNAPFWFTVVT